ncbi:hypothetical protein L1N85_15885 [Paenibacillus alkaliterrae]|uniref:hypothetical protein n=1 Tax=Paenibacillus alkaliterrae TaxID=320909 RepID=UPI001F3EE587|nr:hypothetical protein [Paenibacillus alkaliterrae]MCF2939897.1 hypothetical protein [Paenibacillus alkaliterrae]
MLARKITVSAFVFILIIVAGGVWSYHIARQRSNETFLAPYNYSFTIYSTKYSTNTMDRSYPFSPREYIRIIHRVKNEPN